VDLLHQRRPELALVGGNGAALITGVGRSLLVEQQPRNVPNEKIRMRRHVVAVTTVALLSAPLLAGSTLTATASAAETTATTVTAAAAGTPVYARLYNQGTGLCLANPSSSQTSGTVMIQWSCSNSDSNYWSLQPMTGGGNHVVNKASGQCLAIPSGSTTLGVKAIQWPCDDEQNDEQVWVHDGIDQLRNAKTGLCLAIPNGTTTAGTEAIQWNCDAVNATSPNLDRQWLW
jgi:hypothetical protein